MQMESNDLSIDPQAPCSMFKIYNPVSSNIQTCSQRFFHLNWKQNLVYSFLQGC